MLIVLIMEKSDILITDLHESIEENEQGLRVVEGERNTITHRIQNMNSDLIKLKVKSDNVIDTEIQGDNIRLKDRLNNLKTPLNTRFRNLELNS